MGGIWCDWQSAWQQALYGPGGFVYSGERPEQHFRTSVHVGTVLAESLLVVLDRIDRALGRPARLDLVDLGAGGGELLSTMVELAPPSVRRRLRPVAVELRPAPGGWTLPWTPELSERVGGLVIAHEWLDALPCPVVHHDGRAVRRVQVRLDGSERLGPAIGGADAAWLRQWWPLHPGERAEVGRGRDRAWHQVVQRVSVGAALAVDYGHVLGERPGAGTLSGYRGGRQVRPVPDGSCDLTAHVSLDSVAAEAAGVRINQADALRALASAAPPPGSWLDRTIRMGQVTELTDPAGLGGFGWVLHPVHLRT